MTCVSSVISQRVADWIKMWFPSAGGKVEKCTQAVSHYVKTHKRMLTVHPVKNQAQFTQTCFETFSLRLSQNKAQNNA